MAVGLRPAALWGGLAKPAADCQNRPAATIRKAPGANGCRLRLPLCGPSWQPVGNLRPIGNRPAGSADSARGTRASFAACRLAGHGRKPALKLLPNTRRIRGRQPLYVRGGSTPGRSSSPFLMPSPHSKSGSTSVAHPSARLPAQGCMRAQDANLRNRMNNTLRLPGHTG
jgi:hypothetical protein